MGKIVLEIGLKHYSDLLELFQKQIISSPSKDSKWAGYTYPLANHIRALLGSLYYLSFGTKLPKPFKEKDWYSDISSMAIITRAIVESYITFANIFIAPANIADRIILFKIWSIGGLSDNVNIAAFNPPPQSEIDKQKTFIANLKNEIKSSPFFSRLTKSEQKKALNGDWRLGKKWSEVAIRAGFEQEFFKKTYAFLSSYSHCGQLSILQQIHIQNKERLWQLVQNFLFYGMLVMCLLIGTFASLNPEAKKVLSDNPSQSKYAAAWGQLALKLKVVND